MVSDNREFIDEFLVESTENLDQLDRDLLALEAQPSDPQRLASIFRTVHTIKGNSGFFGFSKLGALAHSGEHLLGRLRDGKLRLDDRVTGTLYSMVDAVRSILQAIEATGTEGDQDYRDLARRLAAAAAEEAAVSADGVACERETEPDESAGDPLVAERSAGGAELATKPRAAVLDSVRAPAGESPVDAGAPLIPSASLPAPTASAMASQAPTTPPSSPVVTGGSIAESTVRVDVDLLAAILDLVGELVLARNQLRSIDSEDAAVVAVSHRINTVTNALQETAVKTRMQPVDHVFSRFPRTVRDLAVSCGKEVQFSIDGADTELDRTLIESIRDPLTHLIRNAVDHGIEPPEAREAAGKPRAGRLSLRAFNESGRVTIEVADDGGGINVERVREKAVARGIVTAVDAAAFPDERVLQFIFEPGFSTAQTVTNVSGRGVGMDVVRTNIEAIGGTVEIHSRPGQGTTVRVHVPLTLAIMPALIVHCAGERFAVPQAAVNELLPVRRTAAGSQIEGLAHAPVMRVRGRLVPLVFLDTFLGLRTETACREDGTVVLVRVDDREFGIVVDSTRSAAGDRGCRDLLEAASLSTIVIKPIGSLLASLGLYSGATVLGDGGVVLIVDLRGVSRAADLPPIEKERDLVADVTVTERGERYLVCRTRAGRRIALPLAVVTRLEKYRASDVQTAGQRRLVRRGDGFTPLRDADAILGDSVPPLPADTTVNLIVVRDDRGEFGIAVDAILDVVSADATPQAALAATGVVATVALAGLATEVLDLAVPLPTPVST
jgi:two-component system chemotaxis sensor kinase CheA